MLRHTKVQYDPTLDYQAICRAVYGENKCLCVAEKLRVNAHVHFQGYSDFSESAYDRAFTEWTKEHYLRKTKSGSRPVRHMRTVTTEEGFQYMCKEADVSTHVLYKQGLTDEDIQKLHQKSEEHVDELKSGLKRKLHELDQERSPQGLHRQYRLEGLAYYANDDKMPPPNFQKLVLWAMYTSPGASSEVKEYCEVYSTMNGRVSVGS